MRANGGKILRAAHAHNWNLCIDKYIAESEDPRSRWEIERAAKVGTWGGAYHRQCFADGCEIVEGHNPVEMKQCSSCQTVHLYSLRHFTMGLRLFVYSGRLLLTSVPESRLEAAQDQVRRSYVFAQVLTFAKKTSKFHVGKVEAGTGLGRFRRRVDSEFCCVTLSSQILYRYYLIVHMENS